MDMRVPALRGEILLESNPPKSRILARRLAVLCDAGVMHGTAEGRHPIITTVSITVSISIIIISIIIISSSSTTTTTISNIIIIIITIIINISSGTPKGPGICASPSHTANLPDVPLTLVSPSLLTKVAPFSSQYPVFSRSGIALAVAAPCSLDGPPTLRYGQSPCRDSGSQKV